MTLPQEVKEKLKILNVRKSDFVEICRRFTEMSWQTDPDQTERQYWDKREPGHFFNEGTSESPLWEGQMHHMLRFLQMTDAVTGVLLKDAMAVLD
jgi:hypothetical protein